VKAKPALVLLAHGSRSPETSREMEALAAGMEATRPRLSVKGAFLTLRSPSLPQALELAIREGSREIRVLPLFLFSGKHVLEDIPMLFKSLKVKHPQIRLTLLEPVGRHARFPGFLLEAGGYG
jgi:sirohydrochlorin cobaltochelatase